MFNKQIFLYPWPANSIPVQIKMSSWKDSSDFASLAAVLSQAKKLAKSPEKQVSEITKEADILNTETKTFENEPSINPTYKDFPDELDLPLKDSITFKQHKSTISALEFEASGSRFLSGSHDFTVSYWDFNGMVKDQPEPFRFIEPMGSYTVLLRL